MTTRTKIEWTKQTWNPSTGCTKVSPGCQNCFAETMARRLKAMGVKAYEKGFPLSIHPERLKTGCPINTGPLPESIYPMTVKRLFPRSDDPGGGPMQHIEMR